MFRNAFTVIPGEDVKISGVKVGKITSLDVTKDNKAAVVLDITEPGFKDFRKDATCTIRPQSLIGERFVECTPTQPAAEGDPQPPALEQDQGRATARASTCCPTRRRSSRSTSTSSATSCGCPTASACRSSSTSSAPAWPANGDDLREAIREADPALQRDRQGPGDPGRPEQGAGRAGQERRQGPARRWPATSAPGRRLHRQGRTRRAVATRRAPQRHRGEHRSSSRRS